MNMPGAPTRYPPGQGPRAAVAAPDPERVLPTDVGLGVTKAGDFELPVRKPKSYRFVRRAARVL